MTEYGRGPGSEPWHPTDPLYGDQGWEGQQQYHQQPQHPQQATPYEQGGQTYQDPYAQQGYGTDPYQQQAAYQQYPQQGYVDPQQAQAQAYGQAGWDQGYQGHPGQGYDTPGHPGQTYDGTYDGNWETGQAAMAYNAPPADPYGGQQPDLYGTPEAYPPPQPPGHRQQPPEPVVDWAPEPEPEPVRHEPEPEESHPFFTGGDDEDGYEDDEPAPRRGRGGRGDDRDRERRGKEKKRKGKNGVACLVVAAVLVGGVGGIGYFGYQFWQGQFGEDPDFVGTGSGEVQVEIPKGAFGNEIGNILKQAGVVKSVDAFVAAQNKNAKGRSIQAGAYTLKKEMSAESAVALMLDPASQANLIIPEGKRNAWVYEQIDTRLDLAPGSTKEIAVEQADSLGLPDWAKGHKNVKDPLEGFLFPASYPVAKGTKPEDALKKMVSRANQEYTKLDLEGKASAQGLKGPWELLTVASLVQVEGKYKHDFDKVARVVYNRLQPDNTQTAGRLEFDSTVNYLKGTSTLDVGSVEKMRAIKDPYNTYSYDVKGLTPGPISNPGVEALNSAMAPADGPWYYFVSINENKTVFSVTLKEHNQNVAEYEKEREKSGQ
ncbi:endolytic transglycosylase MltG [Streptomyces hydrogenans]|uniref:Endolytic murein transglycosylase n=1 Tax=Streptomyces hydrogenans TaxID=1873719 RepID=A0ABQ3PAS7_9ACTN|nr:endolytic transglycosylase MltG [Streptomyces hydrogenans]GHG28586.1 membrane protein [Streptomyces hydrogenans]GHI22135.1 membrane protein [Streptomyces hydrogenans]